MLKKIAAIVATLLLALPVQTNAQITVPNVFTTTVPVSQLNANFTQFGTDALKRSGGTITGNIAVSSSVTIDGVDIGAVLGGTGTPTFSSVTITGAGQALSVTNKAAINSTAADALDVAGGITAGTGNVAIVDTSGKIPAISSTYFASLSGANLTALPASSITGAWTTVSFAAGDYTASGTMTWTVASGDVAGNNYIRIGNSILWNVYLTQTTVGGTLGGELRLDIPGSVTIAKACSGSYQYLDNGTAGTGTWVGSVGNSYISFYKNLNVVAWTAATDTTWINANMSCEVS